MELSWVADWQPNSCLPFLLPTQLTNAAPCELLQIYRLVDTRTAAHYPEGDSPCIPLYAALKSTSIG